MTGWKCPACGSAHAPTVQTCPNTYPQTLPIGPATAPTPIQWPQHPLPWVDVTWCKL